MPLFNLTINVIVFIALIGLAALAGFAVRSRQLAKKNRQIGQLEKEVLQMSYEVLQVQKEYCELKLQAKDMNIPVISIKQISKEDDPKKEEPEASSREKNISNRTA